MVVIHGEDAVEMGVGIAVEEGLGGKWPESIYAIFGEFGYGRCNDFLLFEACLSAVARVGIECQHGNAWGIDVEVTA